MIGCRRIWKKHILSWPHHVPRGPSHVLLFRTIRIRIQQQQHKPVGGVAPQQEEGGDHTPLDRRCNI